MGAPSKGNRVYNLGSIRNCQTCNHPNRSEIEGLLLKNVKYAQISRKYDTESDPLGVKSLSNHRRKMHNGQPTKAELEKMAKDNKLILRSSIFELDNNFQDVDVLIDEIQSLNIQPDNFAEQRVKYELLHKFFKLRTDMIKTNQAVIEGEKLTDVLKDQEDVAELLKIKNKEAIELA